MPALYGRRSAITIGNRRSERLRVQFSVLRSHTRETNTAHVTVTNKARENRFAVDDGVSPLIIEAGYPDLIGQIFCGTIIDHQTSRQGAEWMMEIDAEDGGPELRRARINETWVKPDVATVFTALARTFGVGIGNALNKAREGDVQGALKEFSAGLTLTGSAGDAFDDMCRSLGYTWSVQDGALLVLGATETIGPKAAFLRTGPGGNLIGSPRRGKEGRVIADTFLQPALIPGSLFELESTDMGGQFRTETSNFTGDTHGPDWAVEVEGVPV